MEVYEIIPGLFLLDTQFELLEDGVKDGVSGLYEESAKTCFDKDYAESTRGRFRPIAWNASIVSQNQGDSILEIPCIVSSNFYNSLGLEVGSKFILRSGKHKFYLKVIHTASRIPSYDRLFSDRALDEEKQSILVSMHAY